MLPAKYQDIFSHLIVYLLYSIKKKFMIVEIETITACNRSCSYCPNSVFDRANLKNIKYMEKKLYYKIIDDLRNMNFSGEIHPHFYGEPLLDERIFELIIYTKKKLPAAYIKIFTNGDYLNIESYKKLVESGIDEIIVTNHSCIDKNTFLKDLIEYRKINKNKVNFNIRNNYFFYNRGGILNFNSITQTKKCILPYERLTIDFSGNVILCCNDYFSSVILGNIKEASILEIWNSPCNKNIRNNIKNGLFKFSICQKCAIKR